MFAQLDIPGNDPKERLEYLRDNPSFMAGKYLGDVLDSCRWGSSQTVMWNAPVRGMTSLVGQWISQNANDLPGLFLEKHHPATLPHIVTSSCSIHPHALKVRDSVKRVRCADRREVFMRPDFVYGNSRIGYFEDSKIPGDYGYDAWKNQEPTERVLFVCYNVLDDTAMALSLEEVFKRIDKSGFCADFFVTPKKNFVALTDGHGIAGLVRAWHEQKNGKASLFNNN